MMDNNDKFEIVELGSFENCFPKKPFFNGLN